MYFLYDRKKNRQSSYFRVGAMGIDPLDLKIGTPNLWCIIYQFIARIFEILIFSVDLETKKLKKIENISFFFAKLHSEEFLTFFENISLEKNRDFFQDDFSKISS